MSEEHSLLSAKDEDLEYEENHEVDIHTNRLRESLHLLDVEHEDNVVLNYLICTESVLT